MKTKPKQWFSASEAARYLGVSVDKMRQLDESREVPAGRTTGGHRRFSRKALDAYVARNGRSRPKTNQPKSPPRPIARPRPDPEPVDDEVDAFEPADEGFEPFVDPPPPPPPLNPFEKVARELAERKQRDVEEAPIHRLATLKQYGLDHVPHGAPDIWRAKVASVESFVTLKAFPNRIDDAQAYGIVRGMVDEVLQPYQEEVAHQKADDARKQQEWLDERRVQQLVEYGKSYASSNMGWDWVVLPDAPDCVQFTICIDSPHGDGAYSGCQDGCHGCWRAFTGSRPRGRYSSRRRRSTSCERYRSASVPKMRTASWRT
jgi:excisionase family DNA binding protein